MLGSRVGGCRMMWLGVIALGSVFMPGCARRPGADLVLRGGAIYPLAGPPPAAGTPEPVAEAMAVRGGRIVAVGPEREVRR